MGVRYIVSDGPLTEADSRKLPSVTVPYRPHDEGVRRETTPTGQDDATPEVEIFGIEDRDNFGPRPCQIGSHDANPAVGSL
jgi:hypothetical protein